MQRMIAWLSIVLGGYLCVPSLALAEEEEAQPAARTARPNILFLLSDDQRRDTIQLLGNGRIRTPNLDHLVKEGTSFSRAYCMGSMNPAVCAPSRAMILTGRTLFRATQGTPHKLLPELLREQGYATFGTGKWHHSKESFARSFSAGGAIFFGGMSDHDQVPIHDFDPAGEYRSHPRAGEKFSSELFADATIEFLDRHAKQRTARPFFAYVSFTAPHDPRTPPEKYRAMYKPKWVRFPKNFLPGHPFDNGELTIRDEKLAPWPRTEEVIRQHLVDYYGMITHMDEQIGRVVEALRVNGQLANTIIVFAADHGLAVGSHGLLGKQNVYEHSMGTPLIIGGPGLPKRKKNDAFAYLFDIYPTLCDLSGIPIPDSVEGKSLAKVLRGEQRQVRDSVFTAYKVQRAVRDDRWKLIRYTHINKTQLFDLAIDVAEQHDLSEDPEQQPRIERMMKLLQAWQDELGTDTPLTNPRFSR